MSVSLAQAQQMLSAYINAETEILAGKSISFNGRTISRENLSEIRQGRQEWERKVNALSQTQTTKNRSRFKVARF